MSNIKCQQIQEHFADGTVFENSKLAFARLSLDLISHICLHMYYLY